MLVIEVNLLSGRYHAHNWGEAQFGMAGPEWPPSPWRLLRALAAAWFQSNPAPSTIADRDALLEALGRAPLPDLWVPPTTFRELNFYQPIVVTVPKTGQTKVNHRVLHYDHFAVPAGGRFYIVYNNTTADPQTALLDHLLAKISYLGRAESRARLRVAPEVADCPTGYHRVTPHERELRTSEVIIRRVLCTGPDFQSDDLWKLRNDGNSARPNESHPQHLVDAILKAKKTRPDGTRWVEYAIPRDSLVHDVSRPSQDWAATAEDIQTVHEVHYRLCRRIMIPLSDTVRIARSFRNAAVNAFHRIVPTQHSVLLTGRNEDGTVHKGHEHAYYLPQPMLGRAELNRLVVRVPTAELRLPELDALLSVECLLHRDTYPVKVVVEKVVRTAPSLANSTRWQSLTPFLAPLLHRRGRGSTEPDAQLSRLIRDVFGVDCANVKARRGAGAVSVVRAHLYSGGRPRLTRRYANWFDVEFPNPVAIPFPIGADSHFGLGQFSPACAD